MSQLQESSRSENSRWRRFQDWLVAPSASAYGNEERRIARLATSFLFVVLAFEFTGGLTRFLIGGVSLLEAFTGGLGITFIPTLAAYLLAKVKSYRAAIFIFSVAYSASAYTSLLSQGEATNPALLILIYVAPSLIVASSFLTSWAVLFLTVLNVVAFLIVQTIHSSTLTGQTVVEAAMIAMIGLLLFLLTRFRNNLESFRLDQVQVMNRELEKLTGNLEQRVDERTSELEAANQQATIRAGQLQAITELSEAIAHLQDLNELFPEATRLVNEYFGFYHVGIFLIDSAREYAVLQAANSEGGKRMLARGHRLQLGTGVVGFAAQTGSPRIALDVGKDAVFFNNPDLPETRSEAALPMNARGETIGILDVQSIEAEAFSANDLQILTTLANQVTIAIENARLLTETRAALVQVQEVYDEFTRTEWGRTISKAELKGFRYNSGRIEMLQKRLNGAEIVAAIRNGEITSGLMDEIDGEHATIAVPVQVRGEIIGVIHVEANQASRQWIEDEVSLVKAVAERAAFALENARLFQDARRRAVKEQSISEATARISSAMNIENILHTTVVELERVLGVSEVSIRFQGTE